MPFYWFLLQETLSPSKNLILIRSSSVINCEANAMAGHYLPELAEQIVLYNEKPGLDYKINFKGFAVHNHFSKCDGKWMVVEKFRV